MSEKALRLKKKHSQRKEKFLLGCSNKTRFKSLEHAKKAKERIRYISVMESATGQASSYLPVRAYACGNCAGYHLTQSHVNDCLKVVIEIILIQERLFYGRFSQKTQSFKTTFTTPVTLYSQLLAHKLLLTN